MADEEKIFTICDACIGLGEVPVSDSMWGGTAPVTCPGCNGAGFVEWGKLDGLVEALGKLDDLIDRVGDVKEVVDEIKTVVDGL